MNGNHLAGKLSAIQVKKATPKQKAYKITDGKGLNLEVRPSGSKYWRLSYRFNHKQKTLALGVFPTVSLANARERMLDAKRLLDDGLDPGVVKKQEKAAMGKNTFESVAAEWFDKQSGGWKQSHADKVWQSLKSGAFPHLRNMPIRDIRTSDVLHVVRQVEARGALDVAARVKQRIGSIFRYAIQVGYVEFNPADQLKSVIRVRKVEHRKSIKLDLLPQFLKDLDDYCGYEITKQALKFIIHTFVRPGELRSAEWTDIDIERAIWRIPAEKMKMGDEHIVPLSGQAIQVLEEIREHTGSYQLIFPGTHDRRKSMSENTLTYAIRKRLDYDATAHGFRTTASTILNEEGWRTDLIEKQLAHSERNKVRAAYDRSQYLKMRAEMMQWYSDYLDNLKSGKASVSDLGQKLRVRS